MAVLDHSPFTEVCPLSTLNFNTGFCQLETNEFPIYEANEIVLYILFVPITCGEIICLLKSLLGISERHVRHGASCKMGGAFASIYQNS